MTNPLVPMADIEHVLLDMDGTLLDRHFDDYFWEHLVPEKYAEKHALSLAEAKTFLFGTYKRHEGTLNWTDIDFWSREFALDIPALKAQIRHLIDVHPHAEEFLMEMRRAQKRVHLFTNAHWKSVNLKLDKTGIGKYFDSVVTSFEMGAPKETQEFWHAAQSLTGFDPDRTVFIDDTEAVLSSARKFGIRYVILKGRFSSRQEIKQSSEFLSITDFDELMLGSFE